MRLLADVSTSLLADVRRQVTRGSDRPATHRVSGAASPSLLVVSVKVAVQGGELCG